jgi:anti-sigma regulatory factor (Ser/Thr protein kinase)
MEPPGHIEFVHRSWPADPVQLSTIRHQLADWVAPLRLTDQEIADVVLAVDEAVSNAVEHAYGAGESGRVELTLWTEPGTLSIEVVDHGRWRPPPGDAQHVPETAADASRGITLMSTMMESVLIHFDDRGSRVLLRQHIPQSSAGENQ